MHAHNQTDNKLNWLDFVQWPDGHSTPVMHTETHSGWKMYLLAATIVGANILAKSWISSLQWKKVVTYYLGHLITLQTCTMCVCLLLISTANKNHVKYLCINVTKGSFLKLQSWSQCLHENVWQNMQVCSILRIAKAGYSLTLLRNLATVDFCGMCINDLSASCTYTVCV